jgi:hypothetical protein
MQHQHGVTLVEPHGTLSLYGDLSMAPENGWERLEEDKE